MTIKPTEEDRKLFLERVNAAYAALRKNEKVRREAQEELSEWDGTLLDGLEDEPPWETMEE